MTAVLLMALALAGCATIGGQGARAGDPGRHAVWDRVRSSAVEAARDPWVWGPLAGAAAFQVNSFDRRVSNWAREQTPLFGSQQSAERWSNDLRSAAGVAELAAAAWNLHASDASVSEGARDLAVDLAAVGTTSLVTLGLKNATGRERPNAVSDTSFPSGHASNAAVMTRLAALHLESIDMAPAARRTLDVGLAGLSIGTAWARVEAGWHYPSDVLAGMALGNYLASFFRRAWPGAQEGAPTLSLTLLSDGGIVQWRRDF
jgi:membrane-associated phospholipid phosphatase